MTDQYARWQVSDGVGRLTLNRPPLNVLNLAMLQELADGLESAARDDSLRVLTLRAEGKLFSAGVDVADHTEDKVGDMIPLFDGVCAALRNFPAPTVAVVHGHALGGGCELALCCDMVLAANGAQFGQPEIKLAMIAPVAALRLPELVGYRRAAEMLFTGEAVTAEEAARMGLINRALVADQLDAAADDLVAKISGLSAPALRLCKRAARIGLAGWTADTAAAVEKLYLDELMSTGDVLEGLASFIEKRAPVWNHR